MALILKRDINKQLKDKIQRLIEEGLIDGNKIKIESRYDVCYNWLSKYIPFIPSNNANYCNEIRAMMAITVGKLSNPGYPVLIEVYYNSKLINMARLSAMSDFAPLGVGISIKQRRIFRPLDNYYFSKYYELRSTVSSFVAETFGNYTGDSTFNIHPLKEYQEMTILCNQIINHLHLNNRDNYSDRRRSESFLIRKYNESYGSFHSMNHENLIKNDSPSYDSHQIPETFNILRLDNIDKYPDCVKLVMDDVGYKYGYQYHMLGNDTIRYWNNPYKWMTVPSY